MLVLGINFHMEILAVNLYIFDLPAFNCTIIILVWTSPIQHPYSHCCTGAISSHCVVNLCEHYHVHVNARQIIPAEFSVNNYQLECFASD